MKEIELPAQEQTEIHAPVTQKKELKHLGQITLKPGQKVWRLNKQTNIIDEAVRQQEVIIQKDGTLKKEQRLVVDQENFLYTTAINPANADYKFMRMMGIAAPRPGKLRNRNQQK